LWLARRDEESWSAITTISHLVEPLRLFHPTQIEGDCETFINDEQALGRTAMGLGGLISGEQRHMQ